MVDTSVLLSLADRTAALSVPSVMRPDAWPMGERVDAWARGRGLVLGDPDTSPLGRARCERLAARLFPVADPSGVDLFARWLTWAFALDDTLDETDDRARGSASSVHAVYDDLLRAIRRGHAAPGARPLEGTLVELWRATRDRMSRDWRRRFVTHLEDHRNGCADEAVNRRTGHHPTPEDYPALRRRAGAPFLFDLVEPVLGVELPARLLAAPAWKAFVAATADVIAWSNDIASYDREARRGEAHNLVAVVAAADGVGPFHAAAQATDMIAGRAGEARAAVRAMGVTFDRLRLAGERRDAAGQVVQVLRDAPRAHIDWLVESGRYSPADSPNPRLDALASLR